MRKQIRNLLFSSHLADIELGLVLLQGQRLEAEMRPELYLLLLFGPTGLNRKVVANLIGGFAAKLMDDYLHLDGAFGTDRFDALGRLSTHPEMDEELLMEFGANYHPVHASHRFFLEAASPDLLGKWIGNGKKAKLEGHGLLEFPAGLRGLAELEWLSLRKNQIGSLPEWLGECRSLRHIDLSQNPIRKLGSSIAELFHLQILDLSHCHLDDIRGLQRCPSLISLNLSFNRDLQPDQLRFVPMGLQKLDVRGMPALAALNALDGHHSLQSIRIESVSGDQSEQLDLAVERIPNLGEVLF